jgi:lysophospholipase L1-like esterase
MEHLLRNRKSLGERNPLGLRPLELGAGLLSLAALTAAIVLYARRGFGATAVRRHPGFGRTAVVGDSLVVASPGFVGALADLVSPMTTPGRTFDPFGVVGRGTTAILADLRRSVLGRGYDEVIVEGGMNDVGRSDAVSHITNNLSTMVREAKAAGLKVVLLRMTPWSEARQTIDQVNRIIDAQGRQWGADVIVDVHSPLSNAFDALRSDFVGDRMGIHPNRAGYQAMARAIQVTAYAS